MLIPTRMLSTKALRVQVGANVMEPISSVSPPEATEKVPVCEPDGGPHQGAMTLTWMSSLQDGEDSVPAVSPLDGHVLSWQRLYVEGRERAGIWLEVSVERPGMAPLTCARPPLAGTCTLSQHSCEDDGKWHWSGPRGLEAILHVFSPCHLAGSL